MNNARDQGDRLANDADADGVPDGGLNRSCRRKRPASPSAPRYRRNPVDSTESFARRPARLGTGTQPAAQPRTLSEGSGRRPGTRSGHDPKTLRGCVLAPLIVAMARTLTTGVGGVHRTREHTANMDALEAVGDGSDAQRRASALAATPQVSVETPDGGTNQRAYGLNKS